MDSVGARKSPKFCDTSSRYKMNNLPCRLSTVIWHLIQPLLTLDIDHIVWPRWSSQLPLELLNRNRHLNCMVCHTCFRFLCWSEMNSTPCCIWRSKTLRKVLISGLEYLLGEVPLSLHLHVPRSAALAARQTQRDPETSLWISTHISHRWNELPSTPEAPLLSKNMNTNQREEEDESNSD